MIDYFYNDKNYNPKLQLSLAFFFTFFTIIALGIDSIFLTQNYYDCRNITNILSIIYFLLMLRVSNLYLRKLMVVMVILSYVGELIFCKLLAMYAYRTNTIPLYVPFGHAIVYASGYIFAHTSWAIDHEKKLQIFFALFFISLFIAVAYFFNDTFSLFFGIFFFLILRRKIWQNIYYFIALFVIFIELVGTFFQCWSWKSKIFSVFSVANPPIGAVFFYAGGDVLLAKIVSFWKKNNY